jgi:hypothetical protein
MGRYGATWGNMVHDFALFPVYTNWATNFQIGQQMGNKNS